MRINVSHIAKLANIPVSDKEKNKLEEQLNETVSYVEELDEVDVKDTFPTSQVTGLENVTREDIVKPSLTQKQALSNAKSTYNGFFKVKEILNNES